MGINQFWVHAALFLVSLFYGILFSWAGTIMPKYLHPAAFVLIRVSIAALSFLMISIFLPKPAFSPWKKYKGRLIICAFFGTAMNMLLFFYGLSQTKPINGAVLMMATPLFVVFFEHIQNKTIPSFRVWFGFVVASIAAVFLISNHGFTFDKKNLLGDILVAVNAIFYAIYLVLIKKVMTEVHAIHINKINFSIGTLFILPFGIMPLLNTDFSVIPWQIWIKIVYIVIFTTVVVYQLNAFAVKNSSAALAGAYIYLQPVMAAIISVVISTDKLNWEKVLCILLIIGSIFWATRKKGRN